ncbi:coiled-coil domain-containing protein [Acinetobacter defluvii]|uniref:coiled-coil domain-containing protein n=1 Tax=Acinetobacter defluvii TaxID=1871111 RepID=UPI003AF6BB07
MSDTPKNKDLTEFIAILGTLVIIFCIWASYPRILTAMDEPTPPAKVTIPYKLPAVPEQTENTDKTKFENVGEKYGTYGDSYGSLNTLFSGLAFAVLIISLFMQRQELKAQREELAAQRGELTAQRKEAEQSNKIAEGQRKITEQQATLIKQQIDEAKVQNFYLIFLQYLSSLDTQLNKLKITKDTVSIQHDRIFEIFSKDFIESLENDFNYYETQDQKGEVVSPILLTIQYGKTVNKNNIDLNNTQYLKHILMILNFINENKEHINTLPPINTLLAHISNEAILCFAWIAITRNPNLKFMIEEYGLLRELNHQLKPELIKSIKIFFHEKAFREI